MEQAIKVCGINTVDFARKVEDRLINFMGFIFDKASPRYVSIEKAKEIAEKTYYFIPRVAVFRDSPLEEILKITAEFGVDVIQLHGAYDADTIKALQDKNYEVWLLDNGATPPETFGADGLIIDARRGSQVGGTGEVANWSRVAELKSYGIFTILAGGLGPDNIALAAKLGADVLDLNSKLETAPGVKSIELLDAALAKI